MKIFEKNSGGWRNKVNFVDDNNVVIGYDITQYCCEDADWFFSNKIEGGCDTNDRVNLTEEELVDFNFDASFQEEVAMEGLDEGGCVVFKIVNSKGGSYFLHIYNAQNGYYTHGLHLSRIGEDGEEIKESWRL